PVARYEAPGLALNKRGQTNMSGLPSCYIEVQHSVTMPLPLAPGVVWPVPAARNGTSRRPRGDRLSRTRLRRGASTGNRLPSSAADRPPGAHGGAPGKCVSGSGSAVPPETELHSDPLRVGG